MTFGTKLIAFFSLLIAAFAIYLPFLEGFALTPAIAFIHRFSVTVTIGSFTKTLQPVLFAIPILFVKALFEYKKRHSIQKLVTSPLAKIIAVLTIADLISLLTTTSLTASLSTFIVHMTNLAVFATASIWLSLVSEFLEKETLRKAGIKLVKTFATLLIGFSIVNAVLSVTQFIDCSLSTTGCHVWKSIDSAFPHRLLPVGHQKFSEDPVVARAVGLFGDVNFNGMVSLLIFGLAGSSFFVLEFLKKDKGYNPLKEQKYLMYALAATFISYILTISRSAILGAVGFGIVVAIILIIPMLRVKPLTSEQKKKLSKSALLTVFAIVLLFALGFAIPIKDTSVSSKILSYIGTITNLKTDSSANGHSILFDRAITIGNQSPAFGMGMGTFGKQYSILFEPNDESANPHSTYGMLYSEQGIIGLVAYVFVIIWIWRLAILDIRQTLARVIAQWKNEKRPDREFFLSASFQIFISLIGLGVPFFSLATATYYGFFLPMTWWWGSRAVLTK